MLAKLILDPSEGLPNLQEFARRCQRIADISDRLEELGWHIETELTCDPFVIVSPPEDIEEEDELESTLEQLNVNYEGVGYLDTFDDFDDSELEEEFEDQEFYGDGFDEFEDQEFYGDGFDEVGEYEEDEEDEEDKYDENYIKDVLDDEEIDSLVGKIISGVDCICKCLTLRFDDGSQLILENCEAYLE